MASSPSTAASGRSRTTSGSSATTGRSLVVDAAHDAAPIAAAVNGRRVTAIVLTHGHNDHINAAAALQDLVDAPMLLHPDDRMLWDAVYPDRIPDRDLAEGDTITAAGVELGVLHTPGHSPGCCSFHATAGATASRSCSAATRCSAADPARPAGASATSRRSSTRSAPGCSPCRPRRSCTPATATARRSAPRRRHLDDWIRRGH